jgi:hypothetical protein
MNRPTSDHVRMALSQMIMDANNREAMVRADNMRLLDENAALRAEIVKQGAETNPTADIAPGAENLAGRNNIH